MSSAKRGLPEGYAAITFFHCRWEGFGALGESLEDCFIGVEPSMGALQ
jgi:hypothetical protein